MKEDRNQLIFDFAGNRYFLSSFGLMIFFTISGFLVTQSIFRSDSLKNFAWKRVLRIYPAYVVLTLITVFAIGPVFTTLPVGDYFSHMKTWSYFAENVLITDSDHILPGVFNNTSVNASAWTLSFEIKLYLILLGLSILGIVQRRWIFTLVYLLFILVKISIPVSLIKEHLHFDPQAYYDLGFFFLTGAAIFLWRDVIRINLLSILVAGAAWFIAYQLHVPSDVFETFFFSLLVLWLALKTPPLHFPTQDISYGIYIYAWPVQIIVYYLGGENIKLWQFNCITIPTIIFFGLLSWNLIEKKALANKHLFRARSEKRDLVAGTVKT